MNQNFPFVFLGSAPGVADARTPLFERFDYDCCTVEFIRSGHGVLETGRRRYECGSNDVYILHKHSNHRYWPLRSDPWNKLFFVVNGALMEELLRIYRIDRVAYIPNAPQLLNYFEAFLHLGLGPKKNGEAAVLFHQFVEHCSRIVYDPLNETPASVARLKQSLDASIGKKFVLERFAAELGLTSEHLIREFRRCFGMTPVEYRTVQRIEAAKRLLLHTELSIKEIAAMLCFSDQYYFSGCFRRQTGMPPREYRKR